MANETLKKLIIEHPDVFCGRPFSKGIDKRIAEAHPEISFKDIKIALHRYCSHVQYLTALANGVQRINFDLSDGEWPTREEKDLARSKAKELVKVLKERKKAYFDSLKVTQEAPEEVKPETPIVVKPKTRAEIVAAFKAKAAIKNSSINQLN